MTCDAPTWLMAMLEVCAVVIVISIAAFLAGGVAFCVAGLVREWRSWS